MPGPSKRQGRPGSAAGRPPTPVWVPFCPARGGPVFSSPTSCRRSRSRRRSRGYCSHSDGRRSPIWLALSRRTSRPVRVSRKAFGSAVDRRRSLARTSRSGARTLALRRGLASAKGLQAPTKIDAGQEILSFGRGRRGHRPGGMSS